MPRVLICQGVVYRQPGEYARILEESGFEVVFPEPGGGVLSEDELIANLHGIDATLSSMERYTERVFAHANRLKVISRCGVGFDNVDIEEANRRNVLIGITPDCNHEAVAEQTMALLLAAAKRVVANHRLVAEGEFRRRPTMPLRGATLGLVGCGRIGREVARRARAFGMRVITCRLSLPAGSQDEYGNAVVSTDELWQQSDYISLHAPLNEATRGLISRETLAHMKDGVVLINTSRGGLVDEAALADALSAGKVAAAAIDVYTHEPPADSPLLTAPGVTFSPHVGGADTQSFDLMVNTAAQTIADLYQGHWPDGRLANAGCVAQPWRWPSEIG